MSTTQRAETGNTEADQAAPATAHDMAFDLAAHLADLVLCIDTLQRMGQPARSVLADTFVRESRASLQRFHAWCEAGPDL